MKAVNRTLFFLLCGALLLKCAMEPLSGGSGEETTNGRVIGTVVVPDGSCASNTVVRLFPQSFDPVGDSQIPASTITDSLGQFSLSSVPPGDYSIVAIQKGSGLRAFVSGIAVKNDTVILPVKTLRRPGSIIIALPAGGNGSTGYAFVPGTPFFTFRHDAAAFVQLDSIPAENLPTVSYVSNNNPEQTVTRCNVAVSSGDTTVVWNPQWRYSRTLVLNTSASGANIAGNVLKFPVLVRLNAGTIDFSQAQTGGADIRFTKPDNTFLPHEIERWDRALGVAEIWVKVDTVRGKNATQSILMYWGNPAVADSSNGTAVFDTSAGYQGVWHLGDGASDPAGDATVNGYHGISPDTARPRVAEGVIGRCRQFDGVSDYIAMPYTSNGKVNFPENGNYTVSAWVTIDALDGASHVIAAKGYDQYFMRLTYFPSNTPLWEFAELSSADTWLACTTAATSRQWILVTGVRQGSKQFLYCNGVPVDSTPNIYPTNNFSRNTSSDLSIGKFLTPVDVPNFNDSYCFFKGSIDEVRIMSAARNADWVRLCYMNQRADDRLVVFK